MIWRRSWRGTRGRKNGGSDEPLQPHRWPVRMAPERRSVELLTLTMGVVQVGQTRLEALKSNDTPIEQLRRIKGFREIKWGE